MGGRRGWRREAEVSRVWFRRVSGAPLVEFVVGRVSMVVVGG